ncbi:MAG: hypothetical protein C0404_10560 [Verrucomicrobia bacterium]|nr:hypothetical protein [Verrucomicrobiota bacterium]
MNRRIMILVAMAAGALACAVCWQAVWQTETGPACAVGDNHGSRKYGPVSTETLSLSDVATEPARPAAAVPAGCCERGLPVTSLCNGEKERPDAGLQAVNGVSSLRYEVIDMGVCKPEPSHKPQPAADTDDAYVLGSNATGVRVGFCVFGNQALAMKMEGTDEGILAPLKDDTWSVALAVNGGSEAAGSSGGDSATERPVKWLGTGDAVQLDIKGGKSGRANGINGQGVVVGWIRDEADRLRATLWDADGNPSELDDLVANGDNWNLEQAIGIDDEGRITAIAVRDGERRTVSLAGK